MHKVTPKMTENQLKIVVKGLFEKHDENKNGGIEFGSEFDHFLRDFLPYCGQDFSNMPKDQIRCLFNMADRNWDHSITFEEFYPKALETVKEAGLLIEKSLDGS